MVFYDVVGENLVEELIQQEERAQLRLHRRMLRDISNPFEIPNTLFKKNFRFSKDVTRIIIDMISEHMVQGQRITSIPVYLKILACLHFYASGSYQLSSGQGYSFPMSQPSTSRCIEEVTDVIYNHLLNHL